MNYRVRENSLQPDYYNNVTSLQQKILYTSEWIVISSVVAYLFYRSFISFFFFLLFTRMFFKEKEKEYRKKQMVQLRIQFREFLLSLSGNLQAGYSIENAVREACKDIDMIYVSRTHLSQELHIILNGLSNNIPLEKLLKEFASRSNVEEIMEFSSIFAVSKRNGGNLTQMIQNCSDVIGEKLDVKQEIQVIISSKELESRIMSLVPFFIIAYMNVTNPGFFDILYHNSLGILIMTCCLIIYIIGIILSTKIVQIEV